MTEAVHLDFVKKHRVLMSVSWRATIEMLSLFITPERQSHQRLCTPRSEGRTEWGRSEERSREEGRRTEARAPRASE